MFALKATGVEFFTYRCFAPCNVIKVSGETFKYNMESEVELSEEI